LSYGPLICTAAEPLLRQIVPAADAKTELLSDYSLHPENGPWLIVAATFSGDGAEDQARELALELRREYNMNAYVHQVSFDLADDAPMRGFDAYGRPRRSRFRRDEVTELAVLVGDFPAVDDIEAQRALKRIKQIEPRSLTGEERKDTKQNLAGWRALKNAVLSRKDEDRADELGPMGSAFISRNPLLPAEYFVPRGVDQYVEDMNRGVQYSLLDAPQAYTFKVATFRGRTTLIGAAGSDSKESWSDDSENSLHVAAANAHRLTLALREKGWEAYEFHDRDESIVTVGSFDTYAQQLPDGRVAPTREIEAMIRVFDAAFEPLLTDPNAIATKRKADEVKQRFNQAFSGQGGQVNTALHPRSLIGIPLDVHPQVIEAPKRSISTAYVRDVE
jgi:hypothetical protein